MILLILFSNAVQFGCTGSSDEEIASAKAAYEKKDYNRALAFSDAVLRKTPSSLPAHRIKALSYIGQGSVEAAFNDYDTVEKRYPEIAPALLKEISAGIIKRSLSDENYFVRSAAVKAMGEMGDPEWIPFIVPSLRDPQTFVRFFAVESLGQLGGAEALKLLLAAGKDPDGMVRVGAVKALDDMADLQKHSEKKGGGISGVDMKNVLATFTGDSDVTVRLFALASMAKQGDDSSFNQLLESIKTLPQNARAAAAAALGRSKRKETAPLLNLMITQDDDNLRMYAAEAMGEIASPETYPLLVKALTDVQAPVRGAAATSLGKLGDPRAIPLLQKALEDPDRIVQVSAAEGLKRLGQVKFEVYRAALEEKDYAIRHFALGSLRKVGGKEALPILAEALNDSAPRVRIAAVRAVGEIGGPDAVSLLKKSLTDPDLSVQTYAAGNVGRLLNKGPGKIVRIKGGEP